MVAIKSHQAASLLKSPDKRLEGFLLFGSDAGLVAERAQMLAKALAGREQRPRRGGVDGSIADPRRTPVDDGDEGVAPVAARSDQEVAGQQVRVEPRARTLVLPGRERLLPRGAQRRSVQLVGHLRDRLEGELVALRQRPAAGDVDAGARTLDRRDPAQRQAEPAQRLREGGPVPRVARVRRTALDPAADRPAPRVAAPRLADRDLLGQRDVDVRRQARQPTAVALDLVGRPVDAGNAHDQLVTETEQMVVGAGGGQLAQGERRPLRQLVVDEGADQVEVDVRLVLVQRAHARCQPAATASTDSIACGPRPQQPPTSETPASNHDDTAASGSTSLPSPSHTDATPSHTRPALG